MNYDLIIKLAKLANNNPNENEANLAARKVCKLLAEGNFQFNKGQARPANNPTPPKQPVYDATFYDEVTDFDYQDIYEFFNNRNKKKWYDPPPPPPFKNRVCSECGKTFSSNAGDLYARCADCLSRRTSGDRKDKTIHQCKCGERKWYYNTQKASYICHKCAYHISIIDATAHSWKMA